MAPELVLVTGGSGFIAGHCILQLVEAGYAVRATIRSLAKQDAVRSLLVDAGLADDQAVSFVAADLSSDAGWEQAAAGVDHVLHVASPVMPGHVKDEAVVIEPARQGTLRVLRAAREADVPRVVVTSAFHAVGWGHPHDDHVFTEQDWTVLDGPGVDAYGKSKTLAERAAWDFAREPGSPELVTMLPVAVMGPALGREVSGANHLIKALLDGAMPGVPNVFLPIVDVRDVAAAHVLAMTNPSAAGERFLLSNGPALPMRVVADTIRGHLGQSAKNVPTRAIPDLAIRVGALFSAQAKAARPDLGYARRTSNEKARRVLGWEPRPAPDAVLAAAESLVAKGLVKVSAR